MFYLSRQNTYDHHTLQIKLKTLLYKHDTCLRVNYISIEDMVGPPFELSIYYTRIKLHLLPTLANDTYSIGMDVMIERWKLISSVYLLKSFRMYDVMIER